MDKYPLQKILVWLSLSATVLALSVIGLGAFTRLIDAGLGCPDWPGCYGHLIVSTQSTGISVYKAWAEMIHRYFAGTLSLLIVGIIFFAFVKSNRQLFNKILALVLLLLVVYQIILGQLTVTYKLLPIIVSQHLMGGFLILSSVWLLYLYNKVPRFYFFNPFSKKILPWSLLGLILLFLQIFLGAWTSTNYASLSCSDFPFCDNTFPHFIFYKAAFHLWTPVGINYDGGVLPLLFKQAIQMTHRLGALMVTSYLFIFSCVIIINSADRPDLASTLYRVILLLFIQVSLGIINILLKLPIGFALLHTLVAALLLITYLTFIFKLFYVKAVIK